MKHYELLWLMVPAVAFFLFLALLSAWWRQRELIYIRDWALAYLVGTLGFLIDTSRIVIGDAVSVPANLCFGLAALLTARGICGRYGEQVPTKSFMLIYVVSQAAALWFSFGTTSVIGRGTAVGIGMVAMLILASASILRANKREKLDDALLIVTVAVAVSILLRPAVILLVEGDHLIGSDIARTFWVTSHKFVAIVSWLGFAILFCARIAADLFDHLNTACRTDPLTGLLNRRGFEFAVDRQTGRVRDHTSGVLLVIDIDHFKSFNDSFGHVTGDAVIVGVANAIVTYVPERALVGRMGGEEFAVFLADCPRSTEWLFAEGMRTAIAAHQHSTVPEYRPVTASIGVTSVTGEGSLSDWYARADAALYKAKEAGRNRAVLDRHPAANTKAA